MKKFLLTLIVTMLTCIGAWAQDGTVSQNPVEIKMGESKTITWDPGTWCSPNDYVAVVNFSQGSDVVSVVAAPQWGNLPVSVQISSESEGVAKFTVSIHAKTGWDNVNNVATYDPDAPIKTSEVITVEVKSNGIVLELSPSELNLDLANTTGELLTNTITNAPANYGSRFEFGDGPVETVYSDGEWLQNPIAKAKWDNGAIRIAPRVAGTTTFRWVIYDYSTSKAISKSNAVTINVIDKQCATELTKPADQTVALGYTTKVPVAFAPSTAILSVTSSNPHIQASSVVDGVITLSTTDDATVDETSTIKITPKDGSSAEEVSFTATIVAPVGIESISLAPATETVMLGENVTLVPTFVSKEPGKEPASKHLTWTSLDDDKATVDENGVVTTKARGVVTITATSDEINGETKTATATITIKEELPVKDIMPKSVFKVGETYESLLEMQEGFESLLKDKLYSSSEPDIVSIDETGNFVAKATGPANITVTFNPTTEAEADNYVAWVRGMRLYVTEGEFGLTLAPATISGTKATTSVSGVTLNGETFSDASKYSIAYSLEGAAAGTSIDPATGEVTLPTPAVVQQFAIVATLKPTDEDNYKGAVAKTAVLVEGDKSAGVVLTKHSHTEPGADGNDVEVIDYIEVYVPTPGAFGTETDTDGSILLPTVPSVNVVASTASVDELKAAKKVVVTGLLANSDVQELVDLIGGTVSNPDEPGNCKSLDMGGARMTEAMSYVDEKYIGQPTNANVAVNKCSLVAGVRKVVVDEYNSYYDISKKSMLIAEEIVLPKPAIGVENGTVLPAGMDGLFASWNTNSTNELKSLVIPEGWTEVGDYFSSYKKSQMSEAFQKLTNLELPNSLEKIGAYAFSGLKVQVLEMPYNIKRINKGAFNTCAKLQDVYFHGPAPEFVHTNAFAGQTQYCNNTVKDAQLQNIVDPVITRKEYYNGSGENTVYACILHYPAKYRDDYIDTSREYKVIPADQPYSKGNTTGVSNKYFPTGWDATFKANVEAALTAMGDERDPNSKFEEDFMVDYGVKDAYYGYSMIWPSQSQMTTGFAIAQAGYQWGGQPLRAADQYDPESTYYNGGIDKRGLYQFIVGMNNAEIDFKFEQDKWYTISLAFDMSPEQVKEVFGANTQVCRFSNVVREVVENDEVSKKILKLEFRNSVMCENDGRPDGTHYEADRLTDAGTYTGIRHHYPYMIKPSGEVANEYVSHDANGIWHFYGDGFKGISGFLEDDNVAPVNTEGVTTAGSFVYSFCPVLMQGKFKPYSYALRERKTASDCIHEYVFYRGVRATDKDGNDVVDSEGYYVYTDGGNANQNTAYVTLTGGALGAGADKNYGVEDFKTFFPAKASTTSSSDPAVKAVKSLFGDDVDDNANEIDEVVIVCGTDEVGDNKVYTINGQLVNNGVLAPGLYIKNGKKFIVK